MGKGKIAYRIMTEENYKEAREVALDVFYEREPIRCAIGISKEETRAVYSDCDLRACMETGLSIIAVDEENGGKVVGVSFNATNIVPASTPGGYAPFFEMQRIAFEQSRAVEFNAEIKSRKTSDIFLLMVKEDYTRQGIATTLISKSLELFRERGMEYALSEFSSKYSRKAGLKNGLEIIATVNYEDFEYNGTKPLKSLSEEHGFYCYAAIRLK